MEQLSLAGASWEKLEGRKEKRGMWRIQRENSRSKHWKDSPRSLGRWESCCWNCWSCPRIQRSFLQESRSRRAVGWALPASPWLIPEAGNGVVSFGAPEDSPGAAPPLPGTSGTANPGKVVALSWFLGTNSPPCPFGSCSAAPSPEREFRGGASSWEFRRSLFPAVFQGAASQCSESKELLHPAGSGDPLGAARTLEDDPSPRIPMDFNGKTPLAELLFHERCYKSRPPCRLQLGFGGKNPQSLKKIPGFRVKPSFKIHGNTSLGMREGKTFLGARPGPASSQKKMRAWEKGKGKRLGSGVDNGVQEVGKL